MEELIARYPIKDERWTYQRLTNRFATDISDFNEDTLLDPWKRPFSDGPGRLMKDVRENEIVGWVHTTTVAGTVIECAVYND